MFQIVTSAAVGALALAAASVMAPSPPLPAALARAPEEIPRSFDWRVEPATADDPPGSVQLELAYRTPGHSSNVGIDVAPSVLDGLTPAQLASAGQPVAFVIHRDAGDFRCQGVAGQGRGVGTCLFAANGGFAAALAKRGVGGPDEFQQVLLALHDVGLAYVDELRREGYATPTPYALVLAGSHGAGLRQLKAMDAAGYRFGEVEDLVRVRDHGVSARYIEALRAYGYTRLSAEELVRLRDHGVSTSFISDLRGLGYARLSPDDLVRLRDHGVGAGFVADLRAMGYDGVAPSDLARMRDHGISSGFIRTANADGRRLTPDELIRLRDGGSRD